MLKLQCENCFAPLESLPTPHLFKCTGCGVSYLLKDSEVKEYIPPWQPEGYVECPDGSWQPYCIYSWRSDVPPYERTIGFLSQNWKKEVPLHIPVDVLMKVSTGNEPYLLDRVRLKVRDAVKEVLPPGFDKYKADLTFLFGELDFLSRIGYNSRYSLSRKD